MNTEAQYQVLFRKNVNYIVLSIVPSSNTTNFNIHIEFIVIDSPQLYCLNLYDSIPFYLDDHDKYIKNLLNYIYDYPIHQVTDLLQAIVSFSDKAKELYYEQSN